MVDVKIEHRHPLGPGGLGLERGDGHRAEVAESHRPFLGRVMSGRAKQAEVGFAGLGQLERLQRAARTAQGVFADALVVGGVAVKSWLSESLVMIFCVGTQHFLERRSLRFGPVDLDFHLGLQLFDRASHAERCSAPGAVVGGAAFVGDDRHLRGSFKFSHFFKRDSLEIVLPLGQALGFGERTRPACVFWRLAKNKKPASGERRPPHASGVPPSSALIWAIGINRVSCTPWPKEHFK